MAFNIDSEIVDFSTSVFNDDFFTGLVFSNELAFSVDIDFDDSHFKK